MRVAGVFTILPSGRISGRVVPASRPDKQTSLLELIILGLTIYWLLSFFGQSIIPRILHTGGFIDMLAVVIVLLIIIKFFSQA